MLAIDFFDDYAARLRHFIHGQTSLSSQPASGPPIGDDGAFNELALRLFRLQYGSVLPYRQFCDSLQLSPGRITSWTEIPAVPAGAFKELEFTSLPEAERTTVFCSSGTTGQRPSRHFHNAASLALYEASLWPWFRAHLLASLNETVGAARPTAPGCVRFLFLTPPGAQVPHSSLVHMFETIRRQFGGPDSWYAGEVDVSGAWTLDLDWALRALAGSVSGGHPLVLLGAAFSFVSLLDRLAERELGFPLPSGSRVMETGGYKGRSRVLAPFQLHGRITERLGIPASHIVCEYGMSELSSQAYDRAITERDVRKAEGGTRGADGGVPDAGRCFQFPPWASARIVSPETGQEVADGERGLIRVVDLANMRSVLAVQTEDLAVRRGTGFDLIGRAAQAEPRGCSLMAAL